MVLVQSDYYDHCHYILVHWAQTPGANGVIRFGLPPFRSHSTCVVPSNWAHELSPSTGFQSTQTWARNAAIHV